MSSSEDDLPQCAGPRAVCSRVDLYARPWAERLCRCPSGRQCPSGTGTADGRTVADKNRLLKLCSPVRELPRCRFFTDVTWTVVAEADNTTQQLVHCRCPRGAVAYLVGQRSLPPATAPAPAASPRLQYSFACSPQSRLRCHRKEPCRLFTVRKRQGLVDEANVSTLCQCPLGHECPVHHTDRDVVQSHAYPRDAFRVYSGYCTPR
ncbi:protein giant-lens [Bacillus rossius redtenbacheri]|uniref:protein giant-lens n=1 Tax=Bacillus rossius redtenbacheri TaxID=93214 RepID=UPI002FDD9F6E